MTKKLLIFSKKEYFKVKYVSRLMNTKIEKYEEVYIYIYIYIFFFIERHHFQNVMVRFISIKW